MDKEEKEAFHLYKILNSLTKNRAFVIEFGQKEGGRAIERLFELLKGAATHYAQQKILAVLCNLGQEESNRKYIFEKGTEELRKVLADKKTHRTVLDEAVRLLNSILPSKHQVQQGLYYCPRRFRLH